MSTPMIRVRHLSHRFGSTEVLRDVSFDVNEGEIFGFIGPNGAGKTTTIRILTTLLEPNAGRVEINGHDIGVEPEAVRTLIGYMPDHAGIYEHVSVREYLEFFTDAYRIRRPGAPYTAVGSVMELTDLTTVSDKLVSTLSKGMKQRLQLARILLHDPRVLILDEPASDLDPRARIEMRNLLIELRKMGKTILLSSHILTELADVCTRVAILERGRLVATGPIDAIATPQGKKVIRVTALAPHIAVANVLAGHPLVERVESFSSTLDSSVTLVTVTGGNDIVARIVHTLVVAHLAVIGVEPEHHELERVFLEVTKGEVQ